MSDEFHAITAQPDFRARSREALDSPVLQGAIHGARAKFVEKRRKAVAAVPEFEAMRDRARAVRQHSLDNLAELLELFERRVTEAGGQVHWAETPDDMRRIVLDLCRDVGARTVTKGKSMISEEVALNETLADAGITPHETDLGEYILQLAEQPPSHIIAPAVHLTRGQVVELFRTSHRDLGPRDLDTIKSIVDEARMVLRERYLASDVGITGANALIAETGTAMLVTNEGNGDLTACLPDTHIVTASVEKVVRSLDDASAIVRVLARSATGQPISSYTSFYGAHGARETGKGFHVVLLDNRRSELLAGQFREMMLCIRCAACLNHCPVYQSVGGHAYKSVYPGPMGAVLTPLLRGAKGDYDLPAASSFCGRCQDVCPVRIPLPDMMRALREQERREGLGSRLQRLAVGVFTWLAARPGVYRAATALGIRGLSLVAGDRARLRRIPFAKGWSHTRDLPVGSPSTFQRQWRRRSK